MIFIMILILMPISYLLARADIPNLCFRAKQRNTCKDHVLFNIN